MNKTTKMINKNSALLLDMTDAEARATLFRLIGWIEGAKSHQMTKVALTEYIVKSASSVLAMRRVI